MKPLLAHTYEPHRVTYPCRGQRKLNGVRGLGQFGLFQSRDEMPFGSHMTRLGDRLRKIFPSPIITDGEFYVHGWPLGRINGAVTPIRLTEKEYTKHIQYHIFDIVDFNKSFEERFASIPEFEDAFIKVVPVTVLHDENETNTFYKQCVDDKYEGMMFRLDDCPYTRPKQPNDCRTQFGRRGRLRFLSDKENRCWHLLKKKDWQDGEFDFVSINETIGELGKPGFQVWCLARNREKFKFGSGLTQNEVQFYLENPPIGQKIKGKYLTLSADGIPQNGTILCINPK